MTYTIIVYNNGQYNKIVRSDKDRLHSLLATSTQCSLGSLYAVLMLNGETFLLSLLFVILYTNFLVMTTTNPSQSTAIFIHLHVARWDYAQLHSDDSHVYAVAHVQQMQLFQSVTGLAFAAAGVNWLYVYM